MGVIDDLERSQRELLEAVDSLTVDEMTRQNTIGQWSVRDVVLHIAMWEGEALKGFAIWRRGHEFDVSYARDYFKFNDFWIENLKHLTADQVMRLFNLTHAALIADVSSVSADVWKSRGGVPRWLSDFTFSHNADHISKLRAYRESLGK